MPVPRKRFVPCGGEPAAERFGPPLVGYDPVMTTHNAAEPTIFEALREDHEKQRTLVDLLTKTEGASDGRSELFDRLRAQLEAHAAAEERFFYAPLMEHDLTQEAARHSVAEHKELDDFVEQLEEYDQSGSQWLPTAKRLAERLIHHLDEEEREVFPVAGKALSDDEKTALGRDYRHDMERHLGQASS